MRGWLRCRSEGTQVQQDRPGRGADPAQPRTPRRVRGGKEHGRRRRDPHPDPARLPGRGLRRGQGAHHAARRRSLRRRHGLLAERSGQPRRLRAPVREGGARRGAARARLARGPGRQPDARADRPQVAAGHQAALRRPPPVHHRRRRVRAEALRHPPARPPRGPPPGDPREGQLLHRQLLFTDHRLQGDAELRSADRVLSRPAGRARRVGAGAGSLALLDQHLPQLVARASLPDDRPQRRDQHAARQRQLDARPREHVRVQAVRRRPAEVHPGHRHRGVGLGDVRQRPRAALPRRAVAAARDDDDDPRAVVEPRVDAARAQGLLRVPRLPDGALGRPGVGGLHRRRAHRRHARPQRPAPVALLRHQGRPRRDGVRGRACSTSRPSASSRRGACSRGACSWSTPRRAGSSATTRSRTRWRPPPPTGSG